MRIRDLGHYDVAGCVVLCGLNDSSHIEKGLRECTDVDAFLLDGAHVLV